VIFTYNSKSKNEKYLKRPAFSKLDCTKLKKDFNIEIPNWQDSLRKCLVRCGVKMMIIKRALD
jgi:dTDP-4-dehydrorhamnose reductase